MIELPGWLLLLIAQGAFLLGFTAACLMACGNMKRGVR